MGKLDTDHTNLYYDYKDYCNHNEIKMKDLTVQFIVEKMKNQLEMPSIYTNIEDLYDEIRKIKGKGLLTAINTGAPQSWGNEDLMETIDSKI